MLLLGAGLTGRAAAEDVVADLGAVRFVERFEGSDSGRELLKRNGFAVVPRFYHRMSGPYADMDTPHFITTDSVHNTFHVIFETLLKEAEAGWVQTLKQLSPHAAARLFASVNDVHLHRPGKGQAALSVSLSASLLAIP